MGEEVKEKKPNKIVEGFKGFCTFLYNPDDHTVFGRGGSSWGKILIFYFFFYSCLAAFFAVCLIVMLQTLDADKPTIVGRTNKPMVATPDSRMYTLNFKDPTYWTETYKKGFEALRKKYEANNAANKKFFQWSEETVGNCAQEGKSIYEQKSGCFFIALNRIYDWAPEADMSFSCKWDKGKTGKGNTNPPFDFNLLKEETIKEKLKSFYPWTSLKNNGLQPIQAIEIKVNAEKMSKMTEEDSLDTYLQCTAEGVKGVRPANFEIKYEL